MDRTQPVQTGHTPEPPQPSTVLNERATPEACAADYATRSCTTAEHPGSWGATPHTYGRAS